MSPQPSPTQHWRQHAPDLPPLDVGTAVDTAERLLLLVHYCINWQDGWVQSYRHRYWDHILPARLRIATARSDSLNTWWSQVATSLDCTPQNANRRAEIVQLLAEPASPVLSVMRDQLPALLLRVRIITEAVAAARTPHTSSATDAL